MRGVGGLQHMFSYDCMVLNNNQGKTTIIVHFKPKTIIEKTCLSLGICKYLKITQWQL